MFNKWGGQSSVGEALQIPSALIERTANIITTAYFVYWSPVLQHKIDGLDSTAIFSIGYNWILIDPVSNFRERKIRVGVGNAHRDLDLIVCTQALCKWKAR